MVLIRDHIIVDHIIAGYHDLLTNSAYVFLSAKIRKARFVRFRDNSKLLKSVIFLE